MLKLVLFRTIVPLVITVGLALWVRALWIQPYIIPDNSMSPTFKKGDWILTNPNINVSQWNRGDLVLVSTTEDPWRSPVLSQKQPGTFLKRIIAKSGDSLSFQEGILKVNNKILIPYQIPENKAIVDPKDPRFYIPLLKIPSPGDTLFFSKISLREWDMATHLMIQENPHLNFKTTVSLFENDKEVPIEHYSKYINLSPQQISPDVFDQMSWFSLSSLEAQLKQRFPHKSFQFKKNLFVNGKLTKQYILKNTCYYLLGDNWVESIDSRYWGAVTGVQFVGTPTFLLWNNSSKKGIELFFKKIHKNK